MQASPMSPKRIVLYSPLQVDPASGVLYAKDVTPLSLLTIAGGPVRDGYEVEIIDGALYTQAEAHRRVLAACDGALLYATTGILGYQVADGFLCSRMVKARYPALPAFIGGWFASSAPELQLETGLYEAVALGQGELIFQDIVAAVACGEPLDEVPGLALWRDGGVVRTAQRNATSWSNLPPTPWSIFDFEPYKAQQLAQRNERYVREDIFPPPGGRDYVSFAYYSSFGCPLQCTFCCSPGVSGLRWKAKAAEPMAEELCELSERFGFDTIRYYDANYGVVEARVRGIAEGLIARGKRLWQSGYCQSASITGYARSTLELMAESGVYHILLGGETGSDETMKMIKKTTRGDENIVAARALADVGIQSYLTYVIGFPHEDEASMWRTLEQVRAIHAEIPAAAPEIWPYRPIPGTPMYDEAVALGYRPPRDLLGWGDIGEYRFHQTWEGCIPASITRRKILMGHFVSVARRQRGAARDGIWQRRAKRRIQRDEWRWAGVEAKAFHLFSKLRRGVAALSGA
ncbi:MAG: radical SAM protein [Planctomycetota bacterium]|nr:MAG: radical SAM protein [Planctomycetota bacterium]